jgi:hypothetical protein
MAIPSSELIVDMPAILEYSIAETKQILGPVQEIQARVVASPTLDDL